ncbi:hypothetical protein P2G88_08450 [Aliiglaciecola sp. CAU 1673]|uniref:hypothetical protein n=1 Tax=Aliiglaciecola sp. CAU 1673 TaxID=3032595 RepID=UPI0023DBB3A4|nr:hypothetical protein [Aliiglaciecola sp. CAU 1673]MDF2178279.1 hypothetical protein [Aliiglaciecola sp. CAU 1673]
MKNKIAVCIFAGMMAGQVAAQEQPLTQAYWEFAGRAAITNLDSDTAKQEGVDSSAYSLGFTADYYSNVWVTSLGLDILFYDDNASFRQQVEGTGWLNNGDRSTENSDANAVVASIAFGHQWKFAEENSVAATLQGGYAHVFASERGISNCSNCYSEDIDIDGGMFIQATVEKDVGGWAIGAYVQQFLTGDGLNNSFGVRFSSGF